jgi:hypothetical protein
MPRVSGAFVIRSDLDGKHYSVKFTPHRRQQWSLRPDGFTVELDGEKIRELLGEHREPELAMARSEGWTQFSQSISSDQYAKNADH